MTGAVGDSPASVDQPSVHIRTLETIRLVCVQGPEAFVCGWQQGSVGFEAAHQFLTHVLDR